MRRMMENLSQKHLISEPQLNLFADTDSLLPNEQFPGLIKYMGSKTKIIDYVVQGIDDVYNGGMVVDLFAGSGTLSGALRGQVPILSNDIQSYSKILSGAYLAKLSYSKQELDDILNKIQQSAKEHAEYLQTMIKKYDIDYSSINDLENFTNAENLQRSLIDFEFAENAEYYLFTKDYSGTYWSSRQCTWIDGFRKVAEEYKESDPDLFYIIMASLMFAMSYNSQSTGHYAQYRVAENERSMDDILIYRRKDISSFFIRKFIDLVNFSKAIPNSQNKVLTALDFEACLFDLDEPATIYADPPYAFVHYSRFYHALETLVRYDYPEVLHKGRYRTDRHQSPFSIKTQAPAAFTRMFNLIRDKHSNLVLSYSNTGLISLDTIMEITRTSFGDQYTVTLRNLEYRHSRMGRTGDKDVAVSEALILAKRN